MPKFRSPMLDPLLIRQFVDEDLSIALQVLELRPTKADELQHFSSVVWRVTTRWLLNAGVSSGAILAHSTQAVLTEVSDAALEDPQSEPR